MPNVFRAQAVNGEQFLAWWGYFNLLVNKEGHLSNADRELLAVVVSSVNRCTYCEISHGAALRTFTETPSPPTSWPPTGARPTSRSARPRCAPTPRS